jgi:hypothetical protein
MIDLHANLYIILTAEGAKQAQSTQSQNNVFQFFAIFFFEPLRSLRLMDLAS